MYQSIDVISNARSAKRRVITLLNYCKKIPYKKYSTSEEVYKDLKIPATSIRRWMRDNPELIDYVSYVSRTGQLIFSSLKTKKLLLKLNLVTEFSRHHA